MDEISYVFGVAWGYLKGVLAPVSAKETKK